MDDRQKTALIAPARATEKAMKFNLVRTQNTGFITKPVGQEFDTYDEELKKYMTKNDRGLIKPKKNRETGMSTKIAASTTHIGETKGIWRPNGFYPTLIS